MAFIFVLLGSTFGLIIRLLIKQKYRKKIGFQINYISIVNILASFFLGSLVVLKPMNKNLFFLFYVGFLGCLSTFSSFIYQLFQCIQKRQYLKSIFHYAEVLILSFLFFYIGYFITVFFKT